MALNDKAIFTAAVGYVFTGEAGTALRPTPANIAAFDTSVNNPTLATGWVDLGHTSREDLPEFGFEGGEIETRGTWRSAAVREVTTEVAVDYVVIRLNQFDEEGLSLYYGTDNANTTVAGEFAVGGAVLSSTERALAIVVVDGDRKICFYAPRASIRREEELTMAVDDFSVLPLRATFLDPEADDLQGNGHRFAWIAADTTLFGPQTP